MKKALLAVLAIMTILGMVAACATPTPEVIEKEVVVEKVVKETVVVEKEKVVEKEVVQTVEVEKVVEKMVEKGQLVYNSYMSDPAPREADAEIVSRFMEKYPEVDVTHSIVAHEDFKQAIRAYLTSSTPPDVLTWFAGNRMRFFVDKGLAMDISDLWASEGWNETYPKGMQALSTVDGKQYFLPTSYYWWAVYYHKPTFEKYGLEEPETWEEFLAICETLKENDVTPIVVGTKYRWTAAGWFDYLNMRINGPEFHIDLMLGKEKYDDPRVKEVFTYWGELLDKGYFIENASSYAWQEVLPFMLKGEGAMYLMGQFIMDSLPEENHGDFDFFRFPIINPDVPVGEDAPTDGYFIPANAQNVELAKAFMAYLGSVEAQTYFAEELNRLPTNSEVDPSIFTPETQKGIKLIQGADYVAQFYDRDTTPEMADRGMSAFQDFWANPGKIDDILAQLERDRQQIFEGVEFEEEAAEEPAEELTGRLLYNSYMSDPAPREADAEIVKRFSEQHDGVEVIHSVVAHEDFKQAIRAYLTSSTPPDVLTWFAGNRMRFFVDKGLAMDISDLWASEGWNETYPKGMQALSTVDGKQYFLPTSYYWWAVYYHKPTFEKYGLEEPETWEEFLAICETLKENDVTPIVVGTKYRWTAAGWFDYLNMRINGPEFHIDLMLGKEKYDDPRVKEVFTYWGELLDKGYFIENASSYAWQEVLPFMLKGEGAMYLMGQFIMDSLPEENHGDFDFFRFPIINPDVPVGEDAPTDGYFIPANAQNVELAKAFMAYLGSVEAQTYFAEELNRLPTNSEVDPSIFTPETQKGIKLIQGADYVAQFYDRDTTPEMADRGMSAFQDFWANPDKIDDILAQLEKDRQDIFAEEE